MGVDGAPVRSDGRVAGTMKSERADSGAAGGRLRRWVAVAVLLAVAFGLRAWKLQGQSLSCDEIVEASVARLPTSQIVTYPDGFPPLYHLLLAGWTRLSPLPESGRWLSALLGVALVYGVYRLARDEVDRATGHVAGGLAAVSPLLIYFSQEMRAYSLYLCLTTFSLLTFFRALRSDSAKSWAAFVLTSALSVYTHYYAVLTCALLGLLLLYYRPRWTEIRRGLTAFVALACLSLPAAALLRGDVDYQSEGFAAKAPLAATLGHTAFAMFGGFSLGPSLDELHSVSMREAVAHAAPWAALFVPAALWLMVRGWQELRTRSLGEGVVFLALASAPAIGLAGALADVGPKVRYWSWIVVPLAVWLAAGAVRGWRAPGKWITAAALAVVVTLNAIAAMNRYADSRYANEDIRGIAEYLSHDLSKRVPVFVVSDYMAPPVRYYLNGEPTLHNWLPHLDRADARATGAQNFSPSYPWVIHPRTEDEVRGSAPLDEDSMKRWLSDLHSLASADGRFWLVYTRAYHGDPDGKLLAYLQQRRWIEAERDFSGVRLYRGKLPTGETTP